MKIRKAKLSDAKKLSTLMMKVIGDTHYYSKEAIKEEKRKHNESALMEYLSDAKYYYSFLAEEENEIMGFVIGRNEAGVFWLDWVGVDKRYRKRGIATGLLNEIEKYLRSSGVHKIWCDTRTNNKESISLCKKLKYRKLGKFRNGWYKQDFYLWEKDI
jgi:ribosomal protein S18 acetylase RimI-like enzyme